LTDNAEAGLKEAQRICPDLIICDIGLPGDTDGYAVARAIRKNSRFAKTYLVALSGYGQNSDKLKSKESGFDAHLTKPVRMEQLDEILISASKRT
jgi:CheY-like chemotaxis protein